MVPGFLYVLEHTEDEKDRYRARHAHWPARTEGNGGLGLSHESRSALRLRPLKSTSRVVGWFRALNNVFWRHVCVEHCSGQCPKAEGPVPSVDSKHTSQHSATAHPCEHSPIAIHPSTLVGAVRASTAATTPAGKAILQGPVPAWSSAFCWNSCSLLQHQQHTQQQCQQQQQHDQQPQGARRVQVQALHTAAWRALCHEDGHRLYAAGCMGPTP